MMCEAGSPPEGIAALIAGAKALTGWDENRSVRKLNLHTADFKEIETWFAGFYESPWSKAVVVYHFEAEGENRTRWSVFANHQFSGARKILSLFARNRILERTEQDMQQLKLLIETEAVESRQ